MFVAFIWLTIVEYRQPVSALTISLTSALLLVGTSEGLIHVYDVASHQLLRSFSAHTGLSITYLRTMLKPPDLTGHVSLSLSAGGSADAKDMIPVKPVAPFQRMQDPKAREAHEVTLMLPVQPSVSNVFSVTFCSTDRRCRDPRRPSFHTQRKS